MKAKALLLTIITAMLTMSLTAQTNTKDVTTRKYTKENPLVYEDSWDLWPYSFLNEEGKPTGFNIELIDAIMRRLDIPYVVKLKAEEDAFRDLGDRHSDLMCGMYTEEHKKYGLFSNNVICLFTHSIVSPIDQPIEVRSFNDIKGHKVIVSENSFSYQEMIAAGIEEYAIPQTDMNEAVIFMSVSDSGRVLWNSMSLKWLINKYHLNNLKITPINMRHGEYRFMANDTVLLEKIDSVFSIMMADEELQSIRSKWFYPELQQKSIPQYAWVIGIAVMVIILAILLFFIIYRNREKAVSKVMHNQAARVGLYLRSGKISLWTFNLETERFVTLDENGKENEEYSKIGFSVFFKKEDYDSMCQAIDEIVLGQTETKSLLVRCHKPGIDTDYYFDMRISVMRWNNGKPSILLGTQKNVTESRKRYINATDLMLKYQTLFNETQIDIGYFNPDGILIDCNRKACQTFGLGDIKSIVAQNLHISKFLASKEVVLDNEYVAYTAMVDVPKEHFKGTVLNGIASGQKRIAYEVSLIPIRDNDDNLLGTFLCGRDVSDIANIMRESREKAKIIEKATKNIKNYIANIDIALKVSNIWMIKYFPDHHEMELTHEINKAPTKLSQFDLLDYMDPCSHADIISTMKRMDKREIETINLKVKKRNGNDTSDEIWYSLDGVLIKGNTDIEDHYFGLCRNISLLEATEKQLKEKREKAQEAELVKNAFLENMSYEIRTPLNVIVGYSELFISEHDPADEPLFIEEIKKASGTLLMLVNDILFLSRLDANMVEIKTTPTDFAALFLMQTQMSWCNVSSEVNTIAESDYESLILDIDPNNLGKIIELIIRNSTMFTKKGMIRARYEYKREEIRISIEDTGVGIPEDVMPHIFENLTLDEDIDQCRSRMALMICKKLTERMGGEIEIESKVGKGTNIWITIPAKRCDEDKKIIVD